MSIAINCVQFRHVYVDIAFWVHFTQMWIAAWVYFSLIQFKHFSFASKSSKNISPKLIFCRPWTDNLTIVNIGIVKTINYAVSMLSCSKNNFILKKYRKSWAYLHYCLLLIAYDFFFQLKINRITREATYIRLKNNWVAIFVSIKYTLAATNVPSILLWPRACQEKFAGGGFKGAKKNATNIKNHYILIKKKIWGGSLTL